MRVQLAASLMQRLERRARQFELPARLQGDRTAAIVGEADDVLAVEHRMPAEAPHLLEHGADAAVALIRHGTQIGAAEDEFLVLGADAPFGTRLAAGGEILDKLTLVGDGRAAGMRGCRHKPDSP